jgi:hypothetical protein
MRHASLTGGPLNCRCRGRDRTEFSLQPRLIEDVDLQAVRRMHHGEAGHPDRALIGKA